MATPVNPLFIPSTIDTTVLNTTLADYQKTLTDNIYNSNIVLRLADAAGNKKMIDGGGSIVEPLIESEQDEGGFYLGADVLNNTQGNTLTQVEYRWQNAYEPIQITRDEERSNSGAMHKILPLVGTKTLLSEKAINKRMEQALSTPVGEANNLNDLETICNTGTLGSIAGGTDTFWQSTVTASGAFATQGLTDMTTAYYAVSGSANEENPTHGLTTKAIFQKYEQTRLPLERISNGDLSANAGFRNLTFKGIPIMYGNFVGTGLMFLLNMNYVILAVDSATDFVTTEFITPTNQTVKVAYILWRGNLITNNRRRQAKLTGIT
jgi:hypothetical protein